MNSNVFAKDVAVAAIDYTTVTDQTVNASLPTITFPTPAGWLAESTPKAETGDSKERGGKLNERTKPKSESSVLITTPY